MATVETTLEVRLKGQRRAKRQPVTVYLSAASLRVYAPGDETRTKPVWIVKVEVERAAGEPWYLLTDWPVTSETEALRVLRFYRRRPSVEDTFKFVKTCFGAEEVQMLRLEAVRRLVAYAWVAAGFLFHLGLTLDDAEVRLLARLGGWEPRTARPASLFSPAVCGACWIGSPPTRFCRIISTSLATYRPLSNVCSPVPAVRF